MQLFQHRISTDDSKIHDSCAAWCALRAQNHSQGVLLPGLPFYLEQPGRAHDWTPLASLLSRERVWDRRLVGLTEFRGADCGPPRHTSCITALVGLPALPS